jgi:small subunit ribosomal protein S18
MSDRAKIRARRVSGNCAQHQRDVATAIKTAREVALLPYTVRVTSSRGGGRPGRGDRDDRGGGRDRDRGDRDLELDTSPLATDVADEAEAPEADLDLDLDLGAAGGDDE